MKKSIFALLVAGMCVAPSIASAASTPYVSASVGIGILCDSDVSLLGVTVNKAISYKTGVPFGGAVGVKMDDYRAELALGYQSNDVDKVVSVPYAGATVKLFTYMANGYYDIGVKNSSITPYLMGGLGGTHVTLSDNGVDLTHNVFAWQLGAGVGIKASDQLVVDVGYRYLSPSKFTDGGVDMTLASSNFMAGVRYSF